MKVLIYPHTLEVGGAQLNAIEIAGALRAFGHEVTVFGRPGALNARLDQLGLEFVAAPEPRRRPSPAVVGALVDLIDERGIEVVHGHEWPPALECLLAARRRPAVTAVGTVASMAVAPFIPHDLPLLVGTEQIEAVERRTGRTRLGLLEPPVDVAANRPGLDLGVDRFRDRWDVAGDRRTIVVVSRLATELKLEGILAAVDVVGELARELAVQLVVVGDGPARDVVARHADDANRRAGSNAVIRTGELFDPRPAYAIADVALGMGASALRSMAFAKPLVVQGENGFWRTLDQDSLADFLWTGWYGYGDDPTAGPVRLAAILRDLLADPRRRDRLGAFGRSVVEQRYALSRVASIQSDFYADARLAGVDRQRLLGDVAAALRYGRYQFRRRAARAMGRRSVDDFNARPVVRTAGARRLDPV